MSGRGGRVVGSDSAGGGFSVVHCEVPLREVTTYARTLSSMTGGMGTYSMEFSHYEPMPANVQHELITKSTVACNDDE
jgi:elongation factor G